MVGHLNHGERTDWIPRARHILLDEFAALRAQSLAALDSMRLAPEDMAREGRHPDFGPVTLGGEVGPWRAYLPVLGDRSAR